MKTANLFRILALWMVLCLPALGASLTVDRIDGVTASVAVKAPVKAATTANISSLSGTQTIDGVSLVAEDRILVKNQTTSSANGIYVVKSTAWERAKDFDGNRDVVRGSLVMVTDGSTNGNTYWRVSASNPVTIGTTSLTFERGAGSDSAAVAFLQAGTGAVTRTAQDKDRERVSLADFGGVCDNSTDMGPALQLAVNALGSIGGGRGGDVELPGGLCKVVTQVSITANNVRLVGKGQTATVLVVTSTSLNPLVATSVTGFRLQRLGINGPGAGSSAVGLQLTNVYESTLEDIHVTGFNIGIMFSPGANSSFSNAILNSRIVGNNTTNIVGQAQTHSLRFYNVTFGGGPAQYGFRLFDSVDGSFMGGNCEGVTQACMDIDATTDNPAFAGYKIDSIHFENNTSAEADVLLGRTNPVYGALISNNTFRAGTGAAYPIKIVKGQNITMTANNVTSGYTTSSFPYLGTVVNITSVGNLWPVSNFLGVIGQDARIGGTDLATAAASNLEVQGATGITMARNSISTATPNILTFRQRDAASTWVNYGTIEGSLIAATAGSTSAQMLVKVKEAGADITSGTFDLYGFAPRTRTFSGLSTGTPPDGRMVYCSDCTVANPCAGSGTGAIAKRLNGAWVCN